MSQRWSCMIRSTEQRNSMKIDRVIFCLNDSPTYTGFWNSFSRVWKQKYDIHPTVMFVGTEDALKRSNLSQQWGDIIRLDPVEECIVDPKQDWSVTWAMFFGASLFENEVCVTMGIDQIPLSNAFFDFLLKAEELDNDKYVVALSGAYQQYNMSHYPSAWHIAKGSVFKKILQIDSDWEKEVKKVFASRNKYATLPENFWALDECYSSDMIQQYAAKQENNEIRLMPRFYQDYWNPRRVDRNKRMQYDINLLQAGEYTELHAPRPFDANKEYILKLIEDLLG